MEHIDRHISLYVLKSKRANRAPEYMGTNMFQMLTKPVSVVIFYKLTKRK